MDFVFPFSGPYLGIWIIVSAGKFKGNLGNKREINSHTYVEWIFEVAHLKRERERELGCLLVTAATVNYMLFESVMKGVA